MKASALFPLIAALAAGGSACANPVSLTAQNEVLTEDLTVYALSGTPPSFPSAVHTPSLSVVRADGTLNFDIAFDIDAQGRAVMYPMALVVAPGTQAHQVGLQKPTGTFDDVSRAPNSGYVTTAAVTLVAGEFAVIESTLANLCGYPYPLTMYAKIRVDSIRPAARAIYLHAVADPNCGFRSFALGIPVN
jgi:hypothetical protein